MAEELDISRERNIQAWLRKWYPDLALAEGEAFLPAWFDGSQEAVERLREGIRTALTRRAAERAESLSEDPNHVHLTYGGER